MNRKQQAQKETTIDEKKTRYTITAKEMAALEEIKKAIAQQTSFLEKFKIMNAAQERKPKKFAFGVQPSTATNAAARRTLIDRQKEYTGVKKSRASLSPE